MLRYASMLSDGGAKSRLSGNVDGGIVAIEQRGGRNDADLVLGRVGSDLGVRHVANLPRTRSTRTPAGQRGSEPGETPDRWGPLASPARSPGIIVFLVKRVQSRKPG